MPTTQQIEWADGSGDKIYISASEFSGNQQVAVSSDPNTGAARSKVVTFTAGNVSQTLTVQQAAGQNVPIFHKYLIFDGTAYVNTDIVPSNQASFLGNFGDETLTGAGAGQRMFIVPASGSVQTGFIISPSATTNSYRQFTVYYGSTATSGNKRLNWTTKRYNVFLTPSRCGYGNTVTSITKGSGTPTGPLVIGQNASGSGQAYTGKIGDFKVYGDDAKNVSSVAGFANYTPVATLRPCEYNGQAGLWNVEENKFYGNAAGSGSLSVSDD